jgi:transposase
MDSPSFEAYVEQVLLPELPASSIVVMDNLAAHKSQTVQKLFDDAGITLRYQPPDSPDLNPIELVWSKVKNGLRTAKVRSQEQLHDAIAGALEQTTPKDIQGFLRHYSVCINY